MGIGTSHGAFFEDDFDHQSGNEYVPKEVIKPKDTGDDNALPPDEGTYDNKAKIIRVGDFDTRLGPSGEESFKLWKQEYAPKDSGEDYDLRGAFKAGVVPDEKTGHWPDTYKKPNHPTFSDQSNYYKYAPQLAGRWDGDVFIPPLRGSSDLPVETIPHSSTKIDLPNAPFGVAGPAEVPEGSHVGQAGSNFFRSTINSIMSLPQRAIENSVFSLATGTYDPSTSVDAALLTVGGGLPFAKKGSVGTGGGNLDNYINMFIKDPKSTLEGIDASKQFHKIYNEQGSAASIKFAHEFEEKATPAQWDAYEAHVNDPLKHPNAKAFSDAEHTANLEYDKANPNWKQEPFNPNDWNSIDELAASKPEFKPSIKDKFENAIKDITSKLMNDAVQERARYHYNVAKGNVPKEALERGYIEPAYRGIKASGDINPVHNHNAINLYSSDSPLLADMYSSYLSKHPGWEVKPGEFGEGSTVAPLLINTKNYHTFDAQGAHWEYANHEAVKEARNLNKEGVIIKNVWDEPNSTKNLSKPHTVYITFEKGASSVKSRFAKAFDKSSPNMLHTIPAVGIGTAAAGYVSMEDHE